MIIIIIIINIEKEIEDSRRYQEEPTTLRTILEGRDKRGE